MVKGIEGCTPWRLRICLLVFLHNFDSVTCPLQFQLLPLGTGVHMDKHWVLIQRIDSEDKARQEMAGKAIVQM